MLLKLQQELNYILNVRPYLSIVHELLQLEGHQKVRFQHTHERLAMVLGVRLCMVLPLQGDRMAGERQCTARRHQCMENPALAPHIMDRR